MINVTQAGQRTLVCRSSFEVYQERQNPPGVLPPAITGAPEPLQ